MVRDAVVFDPSVRVIKAVGEAADVGLPVADDKVEVVRAVALRKEGRVSRSLRPAERAR